MTDEEEYQRVVSYRDKDGFEVPMHQAVEVFIDFFLGGEYLAVRHMIPYREGVNYEDPEAMLDDDEPVDETETEPSE